MNSFNFESCIKNKVKYIPFDYLQPSKFESAFHYRATLEYSGEVLWSRISVKWSNMIRANFILH